ncbi:ribonuclease H-like domain-containing protein [Phaeosphaeria sp. MPI-PUGE-AT-0046c]|nr:ribonuclease H-like domain-containing protein [Phaeosphaeria sp. MPI-PUGE-AT-0046c]
MEVDAASFPHDLLGLLINISEADFVSFDLELSGIPSRLPNRQPRPGGGKFTLEERYAETREGANRYQILQVGITCARFDYVANKYVLRPYNINISPLLDEKLDLEREISLQSGAITFLLGCGFDMAKPFTHGVQYLSRQEAAQVKQATQDRLDNKNPIADLQLKEGDVESLDFMRRVREAITKWKVTNAESMAITTHTGMKNPPRFMAISRFEKRLVHQLVRAEFPELVSVGRADCVRIIYYDPLREAANNERIKERVNEQIARQTGFRWVFEALARGDVRKANPIYVSQNLGGAMTGDTHNARDRYDRAVDRLNTRQPVLVGHNMFTDIVYLYRTFVGELPETLQGFRDAIHELFPKIVDTKYLATHAEGDLNASPTLQEIAEGLDTQPLPTIETDAEHSKYQEKVAFHEAGYDSLLTATIMIRLAAKLGSKRQKSQIQQIVTATKNGDVQDFVRDGREKVQQPVPLPSIEPEAHLSGRQHRRQKKKSKKPASNDNQARHANTKNIFETLREMRLNPDDTVESPSSSPTSEATVDIDTAETSTWEEQPAAKPGSWVDDMYVQDKTGWVPIEKSEREAMELMPAFDEEFWSEFGNTLRVFGTQEGVFKIKEW